MAVCLVCSAEWVEQNVTCVQCGTTEDDLTLMREKAGGLRFLFGEAMPSDEPKGAESPPPPPKPARRPSKPPPKSTAQAPRPKPPEPLSTDFIRDRDVAVQRAPEPKGALTKRLGAYGLDVVICLFLDYWVLKLILIVSPRPLNDLLTFSLIPVLFVLLTFSFLYYWLFYSVFGRTLGGLLVERIKRT